MTELDSITLQGQTYPIQLKKNKRAKRMNLRVCPIDRAIRLTVPATFSMKKAKHFIATHQSWLEEKVLQIEPQALPQGLMLMGERYEVQVDPLRRRGFICKEEGLIFLPPQNSQGSLKNLLKASAHETLLPLCQAYAAQLGHRVEEISLRDPKSRWGSCSSEGKLMLSWRLILAPPEVARYVCLHEVCHLQHMNHSPAFWGLVASFDPDYTRHRQWLRKKGRTLYSF